MFDEFVSLLSGHGLAGLALAFVILALIYIARINGLVVSGNQARFANVLLSVILAGLSPLNPEAEKALIAVIGSLGSALIFEFIQFVRSRTAK